MKWIPGPVDWGLLVLRLVLGGSFTLHGAQKLFGVFGGPGIEGFTQHGVAHLGFPGPPLLWGYLAAGSEFCGGLAVLLGVLTEFGAAAIAVTMIVAIWKVTGPKGFMVTQGGYEYNLLILAVCAALILAGPGWLALWDPFRFRRGARSGAGWAAAEG